MKKAKSLKAWAIVSGDNKIEPFDIYPTRRIARGGCDDGERVARVQITEIPQK